MARPQGRRRRDGATVSQDIDFTIRGGGDAQMAESQVDRHMLMARTLSGELSDRYDNLTDDQIEELTGRIARYKAAATTWSALLAGFRGW